MLLCDREILKLCEEKQMIEPYVSAKVGAMSWGLSSFGYDCRLGAELWRFDSEDVIDPLNFDKKIGIGAEPIIPGGGFILGSTIEYFRIPRDISVICVGKSTYARCGINVLVTPLEAGWSGNLTLEIANLTRQPVILYPGMGICQLLFFRGKEECDVDYSGGKYDGDIGMQFAKK